MIYIRSAKITAKAGLELTLILVIGKTRSGFTLIEVLGVIVLVGLILALGLPRFQHSEEKTAVKMIARIVKADFKRAKEESLLSENNVTVKFVINGYSFILGGKTIERKFKHYRFNFIIPPQEKSDIDAESALSETNDSIVTEAVANEARPGLPELVYYSDGSCGGLTLGWKTSHYAGIVEVGQNGETTWNYTDSK